MVSDRFHRARSLQISSRALVVEIGSGNDPYWRSDLLVDKYVADSRERPGRTAPLLMDRPLVIGDALRLPFRDQSLDFVLSRNLLEHMIDVDQFLAELVRTGHRGYLTAPSALSEKLFGWDKHVWFVRIEEGTLVLQAKEKSLYDPELTKLFHALYQGNRAFKRFYAKNRHLFVVEHFWEGGIQYRVEGNLDALQAVKVAQASFDLEGTKAALAREQWRGGSRQRLATLARGLASRRGVRRMEDLVDRFACPLCLGAVVAAHSHLQCDDCGASYPVIDGVPLLVGEAAP